MESNIKGGSGRLFICDGIRDILAGYQRLAAEVDAWFAGAAAAHRELINCGSGCSGCCRGLFDITLLDALLLQQGVEELPEETRTRVTVEAGRRIDLMKRQWPEYAHPYLLNHRSEEEWQELMPEEDDTPCVFLADGRCLVYSYRPLTCRLHGLPLIDVSGELMHDEWCSDNFRGVDPLTLAGLQGDFDRFFREEVRLDRELSLQLYGRVICELDTVIPAALLIDFNTIITGGHNSR